MNVFFHIGLAGADPDFTTEAWDEYEHMHAWAGRANVQRALRDSGVRRQNGHPDPTL